MRFIKFLVPFLAIVIPASHKIVSNNTSKTVRNVNETSLNIDETETTTTLLRKFDDSHRFLNFIKHSSHRSHSSHSSHRSHSSGNHSSHYSGSGDCSGCEFDVQEEYSTSNYFKIK